MKHIIDDRADIVNLNNEELYLAGRLYNLEPFAMEQYDGGKFEGVAELASFAAGTCVYVCANRVPSDSNRAETTLAQPLDSLEALSFCRSFQAEGCPCRFWRLKRKFRPI